MSQPGIIVRLGIDRKGKKGNTEMPRLLKFEY